MMIRALRLVLLSALLSTGLAAQPADSTRPISDKCTEPAFREFDFWLGRWIVRDSTGTKVGTSHISRVARGCGIREEWAGTSGSRGTSLNYFNPDTGSWHQDWVGSSGLILHLVGERSGETMTLSGTRSTEEGTVKDRIEWRPLDGNRVRQEWTKSSDGGETWNRVFLGFYEPAPNSSGP